MKKCVLEQMESNNKLEFFLFVFLAGLVLPDDIQWIFGVYLEFFTKLQTVR